METVTSQRSQTAVPGRLSAAQKEPGAKRYGRPHGQGCIQKGLHR